MGSVCIYRLKDQILVHPERETTDGIHVACEPYIVLDLSSSVEAVGVAALNALTHAVGVIPHPKSWSEAAAPRLAAAGVKSEKQFQLSSALVQVVSRNGALEVSPTSNG